MLKRCVIGTREQREVNTIFIGFLGQNWFFSSVLFLVVLTNNKPTNSIWNEARGVDHNETSYYLYDGRGSVTANTWYNGMVTNAYQYDPYGEVTLGSTDHEDFYGYNAESYNPNTGLEYLRARYYNADMGRFFQEDTYLGKITDPLTLNRYAYVKNSPMNYQDISGKDAIIINKTLDNLPVIEHMGALFQDENDNWNFFYWGNSVKLEKVPDESVESLDKLNEFLLKNELNVKKNKPYKESVYIKGDFTSSIESAKEMVEKYKIQYGSNLDSTFNGDYNLFGKNCTQVTMELAGNGMLPGGMSVSDYFARFGNSVSVVPDLNIGFLQTYFYNEAFTREEYENAIAELRAKYEGKGALLQLLYTGVAMNLKIIDGC